MIEVVSPHVVKELWLPLVTVGKQPAAATAASLAALGFCTRARDTIRLRRTARQVREAGDPNRAPASGGVFLSTTAPPVLLPGTAAPGSKPRGDPATPDGEFGKLSRLPLNSNALELSPASGPCIRTANHRAPSLSASAVVVARRFAAHASRSDLRYRTRLPKRWKAGPSPLTR